MNNFNAGGYLNRLLTNITSNYVKMQTNTQVQNSYANAVMTSMNQAAPKSENKLPSELKLTTMEVEETAKYVKELLNMPREITEAISNMASTKGMTTAQNVQLLLMLSSGKIDLNQLAQLLNDNSKAAVAKLVQTLSNAAKMGMTDTGQLKDLIGALGLISTATNDPSSALKNFILLYLPWLPLNTAGENRDFDIGISEKNGAEEEGTENITILIQTMNFSNIKVLLEKQREGRIEILINCIESFPKEKVLSFLKKESEDLNIQTGLIVENTRKETLEQTAPKEAHAEISSTSTVSPQLILMAHSVIKIILKIDKDFS